ncbi:hypothetical protein GB937_008162 [Aspergillus fischeri]|nr:hypothetical protein GB937_008162 [Aspergillus fischeri]
MKLIHATAHSGSGRGSTGKGPDLIKPAKKELGLPYVWESGGCKGPSGGGFVFSGLNKYSICPVSRVTIPRVAQDHSEVTRVGTIIKDGLMIDAGKMGTPMKEQLIWTINNGMLQDTSGANESRVW